MGPERHGIPARHMDDFIQNRNHVGVKTGVKNTVASQVAVDLIRSDPVYQAGSSGTSRTHFISQELRTTGLGKISA